MNEEKSLVDIAIDASLKTRSDLGRDFYWSAIVSAIEKEVLARLKKSEVEPVAGQELTFVQAVQWVEKHGSTNGLQWFYTDKQEWRKGGYCKGISSCFKYRVAPKKVNDPDDPTTWEKCIKVFVRNDEYSAWTLANFAYYDNFNDKFVCHCDWNYAKLATPEQVEAWKLIND